MGKLTCDPGNPISPVFPDLPASPCEIFPHQKSSVFCAHIICCGLVRPRSVPLTMFKTFCRSPLIHGLTKQLQDLQFMWHFRKQLMILLKLYLTSLLTLWTSVNDKSFWFCFSSTGSHVMTDKLTSSPGFPGGPSGPLCPAGPWKTNIIIYICTFQQIQLIGSQYDSLGFRQSETNNGAMRMFYHVSWITNISRRSWRSRLTLESDGNNTINQFDLSFLLYLLWSGVSMML